MQSGERGLDPLLCLRTAVIAGENDPLKYVHLHDASGAVTESVKQATSIVLSHIDTSSMQYAQGSPDTVLPAVSVTRVLRSRDTRNSDGRAPSPETEPDAFVPLAALVFAIQQREERAGAYLRNATLAEIVPLPALERSAVLDYLLGKRDSWEGIVPSSDALDEASATKTQGEADAQVEHVPASKPKRVYVPDPQDAEFVRRIRSKYEIVLLDRDDALRGKLMEEMEDGVPGMRASSDLLALRTIVRPRIEEAKRRSAVPSKVTSSSRAASSKPAGHGARKSRAQDPIILLSNSPTALVNMFNVKALLQDGIFIHPEEARQQAGGIPELVVTIRAPSADENITSAGSGTLSRRILVVDNADAVNRLGNGLPGSDQDPWSRVIAVFTTGQAWQFKSYRWTDPRDLFRNGMLHALTISHGRVHSMEQRSIHITSQRMGRDTFTGALSQSLTIIQVDRTKRHTDKQLVAFFWRSLESWVQRKKPRLLS